MTYMELGWWLGHGLELDGILLVGIPVALDLRRDVQSRPLAGDLARGGARHRRGGASSARTCAR